MFNGCMVLCEWTIMFLTNSPFMLFPVSYRQSCRECLSIYLYVLVWLFLWIKSLEGNGWVKECQRHLTEGQIALQRAGGGSESLVDFLLNLFKLSDLQVYPL